MPGGGGRCDEHFRDEQGLPQLNEEAKRVDPAPATVRKAKPRRDDALFRRTAANGDFSATIADLKQKRIGYEKKIEAIDGAIENLEKIS